jgi:DNA-directed RNA polymerase specialized sigma24 family protein
MTPENLRKAEARYQRAFRASEEAREARNAAVRAALLEGWTHARVAEATGMTRGRVGQLAQVKHDA